MKICIIGPSCVGKTTLADGLSENLKLKHYDLDRVFIDIDQVRKNKMLNYVSKEKSDKMINMILKSKQLGWIVEGVYPIKEIFESADVILYIKRRLWTALHYQWTRFVFDKSQRVDFGFINNLKLSFDILRQYLSTNRNHDTDPLVFNIRKYDTMLAKYPDKIYDINNEVSVSNLLKKIKT